MYANLETEEKEKNVTVNFSSSIIIICKYFSINQNMFNITLRKCIHIQNLQYSVEASCLHYELASRLYRVSGRPVNPEYIVTPANNNTNPYLVDDFLDIEPAVLYRILHILYIAIS